MDDGLDDDAPAREVLRTAGIDGPGPLVARHGWSNRAWIGTTVVVRISSGRLRGSLRHEASVASSLAQRGYPVPEVLAVGDLPDVEHAQWIVSRRVLGLTLAEAWHEMDPAPRRRAGAELGSWLRTLHEQRDLVDLAPEWWLRSIRRDQFHNAYRPPVEMAQVMADAAGELPYADSGLLAEVGAFIDERLPWFEGDADRQVFTHADIHGHNVLVDPGTGSITGILDREGAHRGSADLELDMLLRWCQAADKFPERPGASCTIEEGEALDLVDHVFAGYPELADTPGLRARLELYEVQWHLVQLFFEDYWWGLGHGDPHVAPAPWGELRTLLDGRSHLDAFEL